MSTTPLHKLDPGPPPTSIHVLFWVVIAQSACSVFVGLPLAYVSKDAVLAAMPDQPGVDTEAIWQGASGFIAFLSVVMAMVWIFFAVKLREGRNWARVTMLVLIGLALVFTPINLANTGVIIPATIVPAVIDIAPGLVILILLLTEPAKSWTPAKTRFLKAGPSF